MSLRPLAVILPISRCILTKHVVNLFRTFMLYFVCSVDAVVCLILDVVWNVTAWWGEGWIDFSCSFKAFLLPNFSKFRAKQNSCSHFPHSLICVGNQWTRQESRHVHFPHPDQRPLLSIEMLLNKMNTDMKISGGESLNSQWENVQDIPYMLSRISRPAYEPSSVAQWFST